MTFAFINRKSVSRRTVLRGAGAAIALPLLDSMIPAMTAQAATPGKPIARFGVVYHGNGVAPKHWVPANQGADYELSYSLKPLGQFRSDVLVLSGLDNESAVALPGEPAAGHARCSGAFLTGIHAKPTAGSDFRAGVSIDQLIAQKIGRETQLASLELTLDDNELAGSCDTGFSCVYTSTISWATPTSPVPMENNPRAVFQRLFGDSDSTNADSRAASMNMRRSILDSVLGKIKEFEAKVGPDDRRKLDGYLGSVREIERRIQLAEAHSDMKMPSIARPPGIPESYEEYAKLMYDLQVLAYQTDMTRVTSFMPCREASARTYPYLGFADAHHAISHHGHDATKMERLAKINAHHVSLFTDYLEKLKSTPDGDGSLLDHVTILYGASMGDPDKHDPHELPILLAGGGCGRIKAGSHIRYPKGTQISNLYVTLLRQMGVEVETFGNSTGDLRLA